MLTTSLIKSLLVHTSVGLLPYTQYNSRCENWTSTLHVRYFVGISGLKNGGGPTGRWPWASTRSLCGGEHAIKNFVLKDNNMWGDKGI